MDSYFLPRHEQAESHFCQKKTMDKMNALNALNALNQVSAWDLIIIALKSLILILPIFICVVLGIVIYEIAATVRASRKDKASTERERSSEKTSPETKAPSEIDPFAIGTHTTRAYEHYINDDKHETFPLILCHGSKLTPIIAAKDESLSTFRSDIQRLLSLDYLPTFRV